MADPTGIFKNHYITVDGSRYRVAMDLTGKVLAVVRVQEVVMNINGPKAQKVLRTLENRWADGEYHG